MRDRISEALKGHNADYIEVRIEEGEATRLQYRGRELEDIGMTSSAGGCVRALVKGGWGFISFNDSSELRAKVEKAVRQATLVGREESMLAPVEPEVALVEPEVKKDPSAVSLAAKKQVLDEYNEVIWNVPKIQTSTVMYSDRRKKVTFASSEGSYVEQTKVDLMSRFSAVARDGGNVQQSSLSIGSNGDYGFIENLHSDVEAMARRAVELLSAPQLKGGEYAVVCDPVLAGVFTHEAFGHLSESDFVYENERMREIMVLGRRFGGKHLNIVDGAAVPGLRGSYRYDEEGVPATKTYLITEGVLTGRLHSRETAAKMGEAPTGNARAMDYTFEPIVRADCTHDQHLYRARTSLVRGVDLRHQGRSLRQELVRRYDQHGNVHLLGGRGLHDPQRQSRGATATRRSQRQRLHHPREHRRHRQRSRHERRRRLRQRRPDAAAGLKREPPHTDSEVPAGRRIGPREGSAR
jgi:TldD protein